MTLMCFRNGANRLFRTSFILVVLLVAVAVAADPGEIQTKNGNPREGQATEQLKDILKKYDLSNDTFTRKVVFAQGAMNPAFPALTPNAPIVASADDRLSTLL